MTASLALSSATFVALIICAFVRPDNGAAARSLSNETSHLQSLMCSGPQQPSNGQWKVHSSLCPNNTDCDSPQGVDLEPGTRLVYSCNSGYEVMGSADVFCVRHGKWTSTPVCIVSDKQCGPFLSSSIVVEWCSHRGSFVNCGNPVMPGTTAKVSCAFGYKGDVSDVVRKEVVCREDGQWDPPPIRCIPECGITSAAGFVVPLIVKGMSANITEFPWHATLYREESVNGPKVFRCGATIIQPGLLVTAAHCVYDEVERVVLPANTFYVATGNLFQDYDSPFHDVRLVKKRQVKNIHIDSKYSGLLGNYNADIALLEIEPFVLSSLLRPVCVDYAGCHDNNVWESGAVGRVAGFGVTETGMSSLILQTTTVPFVSISQCKSASAASKSEQFLTADKFCTGYLNGSSICAGDAGGGLVFKVDGLWYLRGIVSISLSNIKNSASGNCAVDAYVGNTRISSYMPWIQNVTRNLGTEPSSSCPNSQKQ